MFKRVVDDNDLGPCIGALAILKFPYTIEVKHDGTKMVYTIALVGDQPAPAAKQLPSAIGEKRNERRTKEEIKEQTKFLADYLKNRRKATNEMILDYMWALDIKWKPQSLSSYLQDAMKVDPGIVRIEKGVYAYSQEVADSAHNSD